MISLLGSEALRIRSRWIVWILAALAVAGMVVASVLLASKSHPASAAALAADHAAYRRSVAACLSGGGSVAGPDAPTRAELCRRLIRPADYLPSGTFGLVLLPQVLQHSAFILIVIGLVIGSSSIGADWASGAVGTLLTWETRRERIWLARVIAVCVGVFVLAIALLMTLTVLLTVVATTRGTTAWLDSTWTRESIETGARVAAMSAFGALLGLSVAMIGRSTGAALAGVFVYLAVFENVVRGVYPSISPWLLGPNVVVFVQGIATSPGTRQVLTMAHAVLVVSLYAVVPFAVALLWFRARDVGT